MTEPGPRPGSVLVQLQQNGQRRQRQKRVDGCRLGVGAVGFVSLAKTSSQTRAQTSSLDSMEFMDL